MPYIFDEVTGKQINVEDIQGFATLDAKGQATGEAYGFGDTSKSRGMLQAAYTPLATSWDYMPKTSADIAQAVALDTMVDSGGIQLAKILAGTVGGIFGGPVGAGIGYMLAEAGSEIYNWIDKAGDDPHKFWNDFHTNMKDFADDNSFQKFWDGTQLGQSYTASGASRALFKDWGDVIGEKGFAVGAGEAVGMLVRSGAAVLSGGVTLEGGGFGTAAIIADISLSSATSEASQEIGLGEDVYKALGVGALHGMASGIAAATFCKGLPYLFSQHAPALVQAVNSNGISSVAATGAEFAGWGLMEDNLINIAEGRDLEINPMQVALGFGLGASFGVLGGAFRKSPRSEAIELINKDLPTYYNTLSKDYSKDSMATMGNRLLKSDKMTGLTGGMYDDGVSLSARIISDHQAVKGYDIAVGSANSIAQRYGINSPAKGYSWSPENISALSNEAVGSGIGKAVTSELFNREISTGAKDVLNEKIGMLRKMGAIKSEADVARFSKKVMQTAVNDNKGSLGNYEIRQAFEKVMSGG